MKDKQIRSEIAANVNSISYPKQIAVSRSNIEYSKSPFEPIQSNPPNPGTEENFEYQSYYTECDQHGQDDVLDNMQTKKPNQLSVSQLELQQVIHSLKKKRTANLMPKLTLQLLEQGKSEELETYCNEEEQLFEDEFNIGDTNNNVSLSQRLQFQEMNVISSIKQVTSDLSQKSTPKLLTLDQITPEPRLPQTQQKQVILGPCSESPCVPTTENLINQDVKTEREQLFEPVVKDSSRKLQRFNKKFRNYDSVENKMQEYVQEQIQQKEDDYRNLQFRFKAMLVILLLVSVLCLIFMSVMIAQSIQIATQVELISREQEDFKILQQQTEMLKDLKCKNTSNENI